MRRPSGALVLMVLGLAGGAKLRVDSFRWGWFTDFGVLHLGGRLFGQGRSDVAYDPQLFLVEAGSLEEGESAAGWVALFISPPTFGWFMAPFGLLDERTASVLWLTIGLLGLWTATRLLRLPFWVAGLVALTPAGLATIVLGQTGFFALLALAAVHRLAVSERRTFAGLVVAALIVKPPLVVGVVLWWLSDWRRWWPALTSAAGGGFVLFGLTFLDGGAAWRWFLGAMSERNEIEHRIWANQATFGELVKRAGGAELQPLAVTLVGLMLGFGVLWLARTRFDAEPVAMSGLATLVSLVASPHLLHYDMVVALVVVACAVDMGWSRRRVELLSGLVVFCVAYGQAFDLLQRAAFGRALAILPLGMVMVTALWLRWMRPVEPVEAAAVTPGARVPAHV